MSRRKPIDTKILEASKQFDASIFTETVKGCFLIFQIIAATKSVSYTLLGIYPS